MTAHSFVYWPLGTALAKQVQAVMDVILHLGAHRTATTTFQNYLRNNEFALLQRGIAVWEPRNTRKGLFHGVLPARSREKAFGRAQGRIALRLNALDQRGVKTLIVSDENVLGTMFANLKSKALYRDAGQRVAHFAHAFDGCLTRVVLSVRGQDRYWGSAIGYHVGRGRSAPSAAQISEIAGSNRTWRDVVTDVACAAGDAVTTVTPQRNAGQNSLAQDTARRGALYGSGSKRTRPMEPVFRQTNRRTNTSMARRSPMAALRRGQHCNLHRRHHAARSRANPASRRPDKRTRHQ